MLHDLWIFSKGKKRPRQSIGELFNIIFVFCLKSCDISYLFEHLLGKKVPAVEYIWTVCMCWLCVNHVLGMCLWCFRRFIDVFINTLVPDVFNMCVQVFLTMFEIADKALNCLLNWVWTVLVERIKNKCLTLRRPTLVIEKVNDGSSFLLIYSLLI